ncbi:T9SS type B sorting domain-containing protein [Gillisia sp. JM1]|uniref:T9SS type B sorting domain-containing protein n=1 Tax=Gillisia sp. JM1 TaxID=1283286 RepID=UPI00040534B4|nr:T9SS type B sorting domain-containing protein [Gillisia sp. JM1]
MNKLFPAILLLFILSFQIVNGQIKLTHNIGENPIDTGMPSCEDYENWARVFELSDFGITSGEQFLIKSIEVAISKSYNGANLQYGVYSVDSKFPESEPLLLGYGGYMILPKIDTPQIIQFDLETPVVVPAGIEKILITIGKSPDSYNPNSAEVIIGGTENDTGESWYTGCRKYYSYTSTDDLEVPVPDANFYINATGETFSTANSGATTSLNHNVCDELINRVIYGCTYGGMGYSRDFILNDFGISENEEFIINSGQIGIGQVKGGTTIKFRIYEIDDNFPASFSDTNLIGASQEVTLDYYNSVTNAVPEIINVEFDNPVVVPKDVKRILVEVYQTKYYMFPAATEVDDGSITWIRSYNGGCTPFGKFLDVRDTGWPKAKLYINVTGNVKHLTNNFQMKISNVCSEFLTEFSVDNESNIASIKWNFGDPSSGEDNTSSERSPFHDFSADGTYIITAKVTGKDGNIELLTETINAKEPPKAYGINDLETCESSAGTGISNSFDTSNIESQVLGNQTDKIVTYIDGSGNEYVALPNPFTNTMRDRESIRVRVARIDEPCCYEETTFDLIVDPVPDLSGIEDIFLCSSDNNGFATFDLTQIQSDISSKDIITEFYFQDGQQIPNSQLNAVVNKIKDQETITVRAINTTTKCYNETEFKIGVTAPPNEITLPDLTGCDDNNDGISEFFDTSVIMDEIPGNQKNLGVSFFDSDGMEMSELPNPYTNLQIKEDYFTVRLRDKISGCYSEMKVLLNTSSKLGINQPSDLYACDEGNGFAFFNTEHITENIIGGQNNLSITFYNTECEQLNDFNNGNFRNLQSYEQEIIAKVENISNKSCFTEVHFNLRTVAPPEILIKDTYQICYTGESLTVETSEMYSVSWFGPYGEILSNNSSISINEAGTYSLSIIKEENGILCESYKEFDLVHSEAPTIDKISYKDFAENSRVEIFTSGDGDFEYSLDGINFQDENFFEDVEGGEYDITIRDKNGCGQAIQLINIINYGRFFTPNNDGYHDTWTIKGISDQTTSFIQIYDRYGKLLVQLDPSSKGWDGNFNGRPMPSNDYWFQVNLNDGKVHSGHFSLIRS